MGFPIKPLKVKLLAGEQKATDNWTLIGGRPLLALSCFLETKNHAGQAGHGSQALGFAAAGRCVSGAGGVFM